MNFSKELPCFKKIGSGMVIFLLGVILVNTLLADPSETKWNP